MNNNLNRKKISCRYKPLLTFLFEYILDILTALCHIALSIPIR